MTRVETQIDLPIQFKLNAVACLVTVLVALGLAGCGSSPSPTASTTTEFSKVWTIVQAKNCNTCHNASNSASATNGFGVINFASQATAYATLTGGSTVKGVSASGNCGSVKLVAAANPTTSYLAGILFSDYNISNFGGVTGCTTAYNSHYSNATFSDADKATIIAWIKDGASNN